MQKKAMILNIGVTTPLSVFSLRLFSLSSTSILPAQCHLQYQNIWSQILLERNHTYDCTAVCLASVCVLHWLKTFNSRMLWFLLFIQPWDGLSKLHIIKQKSSLNIPGSPFLTVLSWNNFLGGTEKEVQHLSFLNDLPTLVSATTLLEKLQFPHPNHEQKLEKFFRSSKIINNLLSEPQRCKALL